ncbi:homeobox protein ARX-like [Oxyura jamaicensis]|uniref:homeobox protein ARX-like n=1 Tax=Oxyura jamaicensis TaxID=8884 RepID=UPI0015A6CB16|nr:homeobox protein ARX-like [Oxyura jamaicensis]
MELVAELRSGGGEARSVRVRCPAAEEGPGGRLRALRLGLGELQERLVQLLAPLERPEAGSGGGAEEDEEEEEEEDEDEENSVEGSSVPEDPPPKRTRVQRP